MKTLPSLVLAPAVAAVTGFAAVPAFAAPGDQAPDTASGQNSTTSSSDSEEGEVSVSLAQDSIAAEQIADSKQGLKFTGTGFTPGDKATVTVIGTDGISYTPDTKLSVSQAGEVKGSYFFSTDKGSKVPEGNYRLFLTDLKTNEATELAKFNVGDKAEDTAEKPAEDEQQAKPEGSAKPEGASESADSASTPAEDKSADASASPSAQPSETSTPAPSQTTQSAQPSETSTPSETPSTSASPEPSDSPSATETAKPEDKAGDKKNEAGDKADDKAAEDKADEKQDDADNKSDEADKPKVTEDQLPTSTLSFSKNRVEDTDFTLSKDEVAQVEVGEKASKQQKEAAQKKSEEFAKEGKGVTLTLKNGLPGASYTFKVQQPGTAKPFELPAKTDSAGTASVWIYDKGTAATGTYKVTVEGAKAVVSDKADEADKETAKPSEAPTAGAGSITPSSTPSSETTVTATATPSPTTEADKKDDAAKDSSDKKTESTAAESNEKLDWNEVRKLDKDKTSNVDIEENVQVAAASFTVFKAAPEPEPEQKTPEPKPEQKTPEQQKPTTPSTTGKDPKPASESEASGMNEKPKAPEAEKPGAEGDADQTEDGAKQKPENNGQAESDTNATADEGDKAEDADQADDAGDKAEDEADAKTDEGDTADAKTDEAAQADQSEQTMTSEQEQEDTSGAEQRRELPNTTPDDHYAQPQESTSSPGSQLPRTGGDLTGLALGAGLVVVGAASIVVTRRKVSGI
ncbi:hypothetical protein CYJ40_06695 [Brevibacterium ravenspurgense]|uniref:Gram-positive cocci surface proteins LPxTG domain-containing protein n=1 Tax=Brevibacterium ravenspurgense TaxID=479117 RepID=A0A2I1IG31_9MICO|nr:LPXTG cell wall anchor domain-containing protein [Brevibacterium ravenspurgense]PKY70073.1 hypothetical protein CYJ40_06695 [Brevibacterium ravenspurgense]